MSVPLVSICLPNLNTRPFLEPRMESILAQAMADWELVVCDSHSDDGSWEYFQKFQDDPRVRLVQVPREGVYAGWNECISRATGKYVYIATSDDTMTRDCLAKMCAALERNPGCDMAICGLQIIDENGQSIPSLWQESPIHQFLGGYLDVQHIRYPPFDAIVSCGWDTTYLSTTQVLTRRTLFETFGLFCVEFGSWGDFEWNIRTGLVAARIHVPEVLATWRRTPTQATQDDDFQTAEWHNTAERMIRRAYSAVERIDLAAARRVSLADLLRPHTEEGLRIALDRGSHLRQVAAAGRQALINPKLSLGYSVKRLMHSTSPTGLGPQQVEWMLRQADLEMSRSIRLGNE